MQQWNKVSRMPAPAIKKMQEELLHKFLTEEIAPRHPYYRSVFDAQGIDPAEIKTIQDLARLPFTEKQDLVPPGGSLSEAKRFVLESPKGSASQSKKKGFSLFGKKEIAPDPSRYLFYTLYFSAGRTAKPIPLEYTHHDLDNLKESGQRAFDILGLTREDTLVNAFTYAPNAYYWQMFYSTTGIGSTALQTGGGKVLGLEKILKAVDSMEAPVLTAAPGYAIFALQTLNHFGFSAANLERIVTGIDYTPLEAVDKIKRLMVAVGARDQKVQRLYFISEAKAGWAECAPDHGYHINPDHILVEIVDPQNGKVLGEGEGGEVVITHLDAHGSVLLRYRTGDIASGGLVTEPCPNCKRTVPRIMGDIERKAHQYRLRGPDGEMQLNGNYLRKKMYARDDVLLWYAEISGNEKTDHLKVVVKGVSGVDDDALVKDLARELSLDLQVPVEAEKSTLDAVANKIGLEKYITEQVIFDTRG